MCRGEVLCKNFNEGWDFLEDFSDKTYEWETTKEAHSMASKISMNKEGKLSMPLLLRMILCFLVCINLIFLFCIVLNLMVTFLPFVLIILSWTTV